MVRTNDGIALRIVSPGGGQRNKVEHVEATDAAGDEREGARPASGTVNLSAAEVAALFEGPALVRATRIAKLTATRFELIFGRARDGARYVNAATLRRIGRAITDPLVVEALRNDPIRYLRAVARERDPEAQLLAAVQCRIDEKRKQAKRKRRR